MLQGTNGLCQQQDNLITAQVKGLLDGNRVTQPAVIAGNTANIVGLAHKGNGAGGLEHAVIILAHIRFGQIDRRTGFCVGGNGNEFHGIR